jgi:hypothetical protein
MRLFRSYLAGETARCVENGIRLQVIGRRDRIPVALRQPPPPKKGNGSFNVGR